MALIDWYDAQHCWHATCFYERMAKRKKPSTGKAAPPDDGGHQGAFTRPEDVSIPEGEDEIGHANEGIVAPDPKVGLPPDHQQDERDRGRPPDQLVEERAEEDNPPLNSDTVRHDG